MTARIHAARLFGSVDVLWIVLALLVGTAYVGGAT
jgi:hypothetical protein